MGNRKCPLFWSTFFEGISFIKLKLISFFNARCTTVSLRGPVLNLTARAKPEFWVSKRTLKKKGHPSSVILAGFFPRNVLFGGMGWDGMGNQKCPLIFFNLRYIKH